MAPTILKRRTKVLGSFLGNDAAPTLVNLDKSDDGSARLSSGERRGTRGVLNSNKTRQIMLREQNFIKI